MATGVVVIGGNVEGVQVALDMANCGIEVTLVEPSPSLRQTEMGDESLLLRPRLLEAASHPKIRLMTETEVVKLEGEEGPFVVTLRQQPRYVNPQACTSCGRCEQSCPVTISSREGEVVHKAIHFPSLGIKAVPSACLVEKKGLPPCNAACPAGINVQGYVALISKGKLKEALDLVREAVPFPHILGRVCTHPCETACTRGKIDQPIGIASLKRYIADMEPAQYSLIPTEEAPASGLGRVAIIGAGPAGLTCARDLLRFGHLATVFEALPVAGGMVAVGMPRFRLPREVREAEISAITRLGIEIKTSTALGKDFTLDSLREEGYKAIFIATGAHKNQMLNIPGEDLEGVIDSIAFLRAINLKRPIDIGHNVVVIGGGYTAIDSARTAIRLHCQKVRILYRRTQEEMSATPAEVLETREEGVDIDFLVAPIRIIGTGGEVTGVECQRMRLGEVDKTGRRRPIPIKGSEFVIEADTVITAIGQLPDLDVFDHESQIRLDNDGKTLMVDSLTLSTNVPGIFAGGDVVNGPESMVEAVAAGRRAAVSIDRYLRGEDISAGRTLTIGEPVSVNLAEVAIPPGQRRRIPCLPISKRVKNFEEVETGYTSSIALRESRRCLNCGGCSECMECVRVCELSAIDHSTPPREIQVEARAIVLAGKPEGVAGSRKVRQSIRHGLYVLDSKAGEEDFPLRLMRASAMAGQVIADLASRNRQIESPVLAPIPPIEPASVTRNGELRIGIFVCRCGGNISNTLDTARLARQFFRRSGVSYAQEIGYACSDDGALEIRDLARQNHLTHVVLAACACCSLDQICFSCSDRRLACKAKLLGPAAADGLSYEFVNIREHCAWVHGTETENAMKKARALILAGIGRVREIQQPGTQNKTAEIRKAALIVGGGPGGLKAASDLAAQGIPTTILYPDRVEDGAGLGNNRRLLEDLERHGVKIIKGARLEDVQGSAGAYRILFEHQGRLRDLSVGVIVVDPAANLSAPLPELLESAIRIKRSGLEEATGPAQGIIVCGTGPATTDPETATLEGSAAASKALALLRQTDVQASPSPAIAAIDPQVCRGCGTCVTVCRFGAPHLVQASPGVFTARIREDTCRGCGTCVAHCPSGAISQSGLSDRHIVASLEALLSPL